MQSILIFSFNFLIGALLLSMVAVPALGQSYNDNFDPARSNVIFTPAGNEATQGLPPPPGHGGPSNVNNGTKNGDQPGTNPPVPTGTPTPDSPGPEYGTYFNHQSQAFRSRVNLLVDRGSQTVNGMSVNRGARVALTFQPDEIPDSKRSQIEGMISKTPGNSGFTSFTSEPYQNIVVSASDLEQIEKILYPPAQPTGTIYPYPGTPAPGDTIRTTPWTTRSYIADDTPAQGYPRYQSRTLPSVNGGPLLNQAVRDFALYLVILGVVVACIQIVFAGMMMAFGHPYAGNKAIAAAGGLMLLLMAFTIWKIDIFHVLMARGQPQGGANAPDSFDVRNPPLDAVEQVEGSDTYNGDMTLSPDKKSEVDQDTAHPDAVLPAIPAPGTGQVQPRSGLPLLPLGSAH